MLTKYTDLDQSKSQTTELEGFKFDPKNHEQILIFDPKNYVTEWEEVATGNWISVAIVHGVSSKFLTLICSTETLSCQKKFELGLSKDTSPKPLSITAIGFYLSIGNPAYFLKVDFSGQSKIESFQYFTRGVNRIYFFKGKMIGQTEDSLYELKVQQDGSYSRDYLIFASLGYIKQVAQTLDHLLVSYEDIPNKTKFMVLQYDFNENYQLQWEAYA